VPEFLFALVDIDFDVASLYRLQQQQQHLFCIAF
jgi:hypothetical protein